MIETAKTQSDEVQIVIPRLTGESPCKSTVYRGSFMDSIASLQNDIES